MGEPSQTIKSFPLTLRTRQEPHDILGFIRVLLHLHEDTPLRSDATDGRKMVTSQLHPQNRRLSPRGVRSHDHRQRIKACFIHKNYRTLLLLRFFFG